jgi:alpha-D-ribose 1-methylphosphonate 5-triphosphate diphosphatase PhnM
VSLPDRGEIAPGNRADILMFDVLAGAPLLHATWSEGARVA